MTQLYSQQIHWVDSYEELARLCKQWRACKLLAVDTEFMRTQTYYPIAALLQVNDGEANYLIDPKAIKNLSPFAELLTDENVVKVLHSCSEDLEVFHRLLNVVPVNLFDTQIAAALCGFGFSIGYANLVKAALGKDLQKSETRSDWLQRPLSQAQIEYAAIDVEDLFHLANLLILKLKNADRLFWLTEECENILGAFVENQNEDLCYKRFKQAWRLSREKLAILQVLAVWRERSAKKRDIPRNRVLKEHALMDIAMMAPEHVGELRKFEGVNERMIRTYGEEIIALVRQVQQAKDEDTLEYPPAIEKPLSGSENKWVKKLRSAVVALAEEQQLAPEILLKKRDYEAITRHFIRQENDDPEHVAHSLKSFISGWRQQLLLDVLTHKICEQE